MMGYHKVDNSLSVFVIAHLVTSYENRLRKLITRRSLVQIQPPLFDFIGFSLMLQILRVFQ